MDWDEAIHAQVAKQMVQGGDWVTPYWGEEYWFRKPLLSIWTRALLFQLFAVNEFWARAGSALCGIGLVILTYLIGKRVHGKTAGLLSALVLLSSYPFVLQARFATTDIMLALFMFAALYAYLIVLGDNARGDNARGGNARAWYGFWTACALAVLTKGAAGLLAPFAILASHALDRGLPDALRSVPFRRGLVLAVALVAPWHAVMYLKYGQAFLSEYLGYQVIHRAVSPIEGHSAPPSFYIDVLRERFFPWSLLTPFALALALRDSIAGDTRMRTTLMLAISVFILFTLAQTKLEWYIVPVYPALAVFTGIMIARAGRRPGITELGALITGAAILLLFVPGRSIALFISAVFLTLLFAAWGKTSVHRPLALAAFALFVTAAIGPLQSLYDRQDDPIARLSRIAASQDPEDREPLIVVSLTGSPSALFYSNRSVRSVSSAQELSSLIQGASLIAGKGGRQAIMAQSDIAALSAEIEIQPLAQADGFVYLLLKRAIVKDAQPLVPVEAAQVPAQWEVSPSREPGI